MTRKLSLTTTVAIVALSVGAPAAFGKVHAAAEVHPVQVQSATSVPRYSDSADAATLSVQGEPQWLTALRLRSEGLNKKYGLGEFASVPRYSDSADGATLSVQGEPQSMTALRIRSEGLNKKYGLGEYATSSPRFSDSADGAIVAGGTEATVVSATGSGTEIEWPQIGAGLGIGLLLALGLGLIARAVHRPFAH